MLQQANFGDTKTRGRARSPLLERYTRTFFRALNQKIPSELLPPAAADCATGKIDPKNEDDEDEKVSTETGQVHIEPSAIVRLLDNVLKALREFSARAGLTSYRCQRSRRAGVGTRMLRRPRLPASPRAAPVPPVYVRQYWWESPKLVYRPVHFAIEGDRGGSACSDRFLFGINGSA
jgi:hypothetical protein